MILDGRRGPPDAARQQQRLLPGQRDSAGSTGRCPRSTPTSSASSALIAERRLAARDRARAPAAEPQPAHPRVLHRHGTGSSSSSPDWGDRLARHRLHRRLRQEKTPFPHDPQLTGKRSTSSCRPPAATARGTAGCLPPGNRPTTSCRGVTLPRSPAFATVRKPARSLPSTR